MQGVQLCTGPPVLDQCCCCERVTEGCAVSMVGTLLMTRQHPQHTEDPGAPGLKVPKPIPGVTPSSE